jgi:threonyl-tRNA synthetase
MEAQVEQVPTPQEKQAAAPAPAAKAAAPKKEKKAQAPKPEEPEWIKHRIALWDELKKNQSAHEDGAPIKITLPDARIIDAVAGKTTPLDIAAMISKKLRDETVAAKVNGQLVDAWRPLEQDGTLELLNVDSEEGKKVFWHSSAHILGQALERKYGIKLCVGPPGKEGDKYHFFYEGRMPNDELKVSKDDFKELNRIIAQIIREKQQFDRLTVPKETALELFKHNPYKSQMLRDKVPEGGSCTVYRCGNLIDPCRGPHVPNTGFVKLLEVMDNSSSYWQANKDNDSLQRVYGIAFRSKEDLERYKNDLIEAEKRNHQNLGKAQELFFFHPLSPGSSFWLPHGARVYNRLVEFIRSEYRKRGFEEVITPNVYNADLWLTSGHWQNYKDNMFAFECEGRQFAMKPMNCPGHCLMFKHRTRSYRELPLRFADFGVLHRNELSGALTGLTRVRRFQQDDAHIFCAANQIEQEVFSCLEFLQHVYGIFGFEFSLELSTRPENYLGEINTWDNAENQLKVVLDKFGRPWKLNPGDGAFYGPKIDIKIQDALRRKHQCATIQLDFQLPIRFELDFMSGEKEGELTRPVIIHRAILGSVERMIAILIEHTAGKWPFWLSPRQVVVIPVSNDAAQNDYVDKVRQRLHDAGFHVDSDLSDKKLDKKIRESQLAQYNYILVCGKEEIDTETVNVRTRDNVRHGTISLNDLIAKLNDHVAKHE